MVHTEEAILAGKHVDKLLRPMGYANFKEYLHSEHWLEFARSYKADLKMPQRCIGCDYENFILHHINYHNLGEESFADVIPLCHRCRLELHKYQSKHKLSNARPDVSLQKIKGWSRVETDRRFAIFRDYWGLPDVSLQAILAPKKKSLPRSTRDYYKLSRDFTNFRRYVADGYSVEQLAAMYKVDAKYVREYIKKYPEYFSK